MAEPARQTPGELLKQRGELADDVIAVRIDGKVFDLLTPVDPSAKLEPIRTSDPEGLSVIRHSAAHVMADAVQRLFPGTQVTIGPAIEAGFYYDFARPEGAFSDKDLQAIEKEMRRIIKDKRPFVREEVTREQAHELFEKLGETFKLQILDGLPGNDVISLYRHGHAKSPQGTWVDLCRGPHVPNTKLIGLPRPASAIRNGLVMRRNIEENRLPRQPRRPRGSRTADYQVSFAKRCRRGVRLRARRERDARASRHPHLGGPRHRARPGGPRRHRRGQPA